MSYIGYLKNRKNLDFSCKKDMESISYFLFITKNKKTIIIKSSK